MDDEQFVQQATQLTAASLRQLTAEVSGQTNTSHISIPEREELIQLISEILPAGNVVGFVFNGIRNVKDREVLASEGRTHVSSLFKGLAIVRNNAFYRMMFAGPATVLAGYNMLLRLAGAQPEQFLPDGAWQFYAEFGLREDTARHSNEVIGFHQSLSQLRSDVSEVQALSAWVLSVMWLLRDYDDLLGLIWEEHDRLRVIEETTGLRQLHRSWEKLRPFNSNGGLDFVAYRRRCFDDFCNERLAGVGPGQQRSFQEIWNDKTQQLRRESLIHAYQQQMSICSYLEAGEYSERRVSISKNDLSVGIVYKGMYFLIDFVDPLDPMALPLVQTQVKRIFETNRGQESELDLFLVESPRSLHPELRRALDRDQRGAVDQLRMSPVIVNWDQIGRDHSLATIRNRRRGIGDHPLTLFYTSESMVFDFSHIYFDGPWSLEISEIMTCLASWYVRYQLNRSVALLKGVAPYKLNLPLGRVRRLVKNTSQIAQGVSAEASFDVSPIGELREILIRKTKPGIHLTVNHLLVLYRSVFNQCYRVSSALENSLVSNKGIIQNIELLDSVELMLMSLRDVNPSLLIPIDAASLDPKERVFPSIFRSPFMDLLNQHRDVLKLMDMVSNKVSRRDDAYQFFNKARVAYLSVLSAFGEVMRRYTAIALSGQSMSTTAIRLVAGLPGGMQRLVDGLPGRFSFMNEAIKGEEVFSNVGRVTAGASLSRFMSAKDDNDKKVLVWGIMTDDNNILSITLRDFRSPILALSSAGFGSLAEQVTQDFLDGYISGFLSFAAELKQIILFSV